MAGSLLDRPLAGSAAREVSLSRRDKRVLVRQAGPVFDGGDAVFSDFLRVA